MDWLLCNKCNSKIRGSVTPFSLTHCGHIFCSKCIPQAIKKCFVCDTIDLKTVLLTDPLLPNIQQYFVPTNDALQTLLKCSNFQEGQRKYLLNRFNEVEKKYAFVKDALYQSDEYAAKCKLESRIMKKKYANLKKELMELKTMIRDQKGYQSVSSTISTPQNAMSCSYDPGSIYLTPVSLPNKSSECPSMSSEKKSQALVYKGPFLVPTITKVLRSGGKKSASGSTQKLQLRHLKSSQE